jgi:hypothetical protein
MPAPYLSANPFLQYVSAASLFDASGVRRTKRYITPDSLLRFSCDVLPTSFFLFFLLSSDKLQAGCRFWILITGALYHTYFYQTGRQVTEPAPNYTKKSLIGRTWAQHPTAHTAAGHTSRLFAFCILHFAFCILHFAFCYQSCRERGRAQFFPEHVRKYSIRSITTAAVVSPSVPFFSFSRVLQSRISFPDSE